MKCRSVIGSLSVRLGELDGVRKWGREGEKLEFRVERWLAGVELLPRWVVGS
jgi:hypothetical protein